VELVIHNEIFNRVYRSYLNLQSSLQIFYGGSSSGKSYFLAQRCILDLIEGKRNYLVARNTAHTLRESTFNQLVETINFFKVKQAFQINISGSMSITCLINDCQVLFRGLDDPEKIKSIKPKKGVITDVWIEEATEISEPSFNQLILRLRGRSPVRKRVTMSFNPISRQHWICKRFFNNKDITASMSDELFILKTTYKDNQFLDKDDIARIEGFKTADSFYYNVYGLGNWGTLGDLVFKNWEIMDLSDAVFPSYKHGLDFGYANDPFVYTKSARGIGSGKFNGRNSIYVTDEIYQTGCTNDIIAEKVKPYSGRELVWCDSAEPKSIAELRMHGLNAHPVKKRRLFGGYAQGRGSAVLFRIQWMQQQRWIIDKNSQGTINEFSLYQWQKDKYGNTIALPVDRDNHGIDSLGYAWENDMIIIKPMMVTSKDLDNKQERETIGVLERLVRKNESMVSQ